MHTGPVTGTRKMPPEDGSAFRGGHQMIRDGAPLL